MLLLITFKKLLNEYCANNTCQGCYRYPSHNAPFNKISLKFSKPFENKNKIRRIFMKSVRVTAFSWSEKNHPRSLGVPAAIETRPTASP